MTKYNLGDETLPWLLACVVVHPWWRVVVLFIGVFLLNVGGTLLIAWIAAWKAK